MSEARSLGELAWGDDPLWLAIPSWDEGDEYEPAYGTAKIVQARSEDEVRAFVRQNGDADWVDVYLIGDRESIPQLPPPKDKA